MAKQRLTTLSGQVDGSQETMKPAYALYDNAILLVILDMWFYSDFRCYFCDLAQAIDFAIS